MDANQFAPVMISKKLLSSPNLTLVKVCHPAPFTTSSAKIRIKGNPVAGALQLGAPAKFLGRTVSGCEVEVERGPITVRTGHGGYHAIRNPSVIVIVADDVFWETFDMAGNLARLSHWLNR